MLIQSIKKHLKISSSSKVADPIKSFPKANPLSNLYDAITELKTGDTALSTMQKKMAFLLNYIGKSVPEPIYKEFCFISQPLLKFISMKQLVTFKQSLECFVEIIKYMKDIMTYGQIYNFKHINYENNNLMQDIFLNMLNCLFNG